MSAAATRSDSASATSTRAETAVAPHSSSDPAVAGGAEVEDVDVARVIGDLGPAGLGVLGADLAHLVLDDLAQRIDPKSVDTAIQPEPQDVQHRRAEA